MHSASGYAAVNGLSSISMAAAVLQIKYSVHLSVHHIYSGFQLYILKTRPLWYLTTLLTLLGVPVLRVRAMQLSDLYVHANWQQRHSICIVHCPPVTLPNISVQLFAGYYYTL